VIERREPGAEASRAAAGVLAVAKTRAPGGALFALRRTGADLFPGLVEELRETTGIDVGYRRRGLLSVAFGEREVEQLAGLVRRRREQGFRAELLRRDALPEFEPRLSPNADAGAWFGGDATVDNGRLVEALYAAARRNGVEFHCGTEVRAIETAGRRVTAIDAGGKRLAPGEVVVAAGAWSREVGALLRVKVPVRPDRGEMIAVRLPGRVRRPLFWGESCIVPRAEGELLIGSTSARGVAEKTVTVRGLTALLGGATRILPALTDAVLLRAWAGLRPCPTIRRPIIGRLRGYDNVILATGHHRSGILLAPITAKLVAELILRRPPSVPLEPFAYRPR